jgi:hypothetical protein
MSPLWHGSAVRVFLEETAAQASGCHFQIEHVLTLLGMIELGFWLVLQLQSTTHPQWRSMQTQEIGNVSFAVLFCAVRIRGARISGRNDSVGYYLALRSLRGGVCGCVGVIFKLST